jgi:hypothetical protein
LCCPIFEFLISLARGSFTLGIVRSPSKPTRS